jgi:hypothetical protein
MFAAEIGSKYLLNLDAPDHEGEVLEVYASNYLGRKSVLKFLRKSMKCYRTQKLTYPTNKISTVPRPVKSEPMWRQILGN